MITTILRELHPGKASDQPHEPEDSLETASWPTDTTPSPDISKTWHSWDAPSELYELPLDENLPQDIVNIVRWSLVQANERKHDASTPEFPAEEFPYLKPAIDLDPTRPTEDASKELLTTHGQENPKTIYRPRNISKDRRCEKVHNLRSTFKTPIHDFSSELKDNLDLARRAKAALEAKEREQSRTVECTSCFVRQYHILESARTLTTLLTTFGEG